tara:strand:- start:9077 stop:10087 length:1011 start_codon:yes stop_codon:yes gene_type:complete
MGFFIKDHVGVKQTSAGPTDPSAIKPSPVETLIKNFRNFSDFVHWPELGDPTLPELKDFLMKLADNDFKFPFRLSEPDLIPVKSNALISRYDKTLGHQMEILQDGKFDVLKFKMGRDFKAEHKALMNLNLKSYLVRIDLNNSLNFKESKEALDMLKKIPNLEYVEDPMDYGDYHWSELEKIVPLALDNYKEFSGRETEYQKESGANKPKHFQYRIVKPLRGFSLAELIQMTIQKKKIVLTNMMDNAVGAWKTYFYYCELKKQFPYHLMTPGFHTHNLYNNYEYAHLLGFDGALWTFQKEKLQKLISILDKLNWLKLNYTDTKSLELILSDAEKDSR